MPAATTKDALIDVTTDTFAKLFALIAPLPPNVSMKVDPEDGISIRDIVGHRAHWAALYVGWTDRLAAGETPDLPATGYKWSELPAYNARVRDLQAGQSWADTLTELEAAHAALIEHITDMPEESLYGAPMIGSKGWTAGRYAEAAGASHYRSAVKVIRGYLRRQGYPLPKAVRGRGNVRTRRD